MRHGEVNNLATRLKQPPDTEIDAKTRMLGAAEVVFAEKGHDRASLRELTTLAEVNLAAVNYHFGSKDGLVNAVFDRLSSRVNRARIKQLEQYLSDQAQAGARPELQVILEIFVTPYLDEGLEHQGLLLARLILQHRLSPSDLTKRIIRKHFDPMAKKFILALSEACPGVDSADIYWRYMFMVSSVVLTVTDSSKDSRVTRLSAGAVDSSRTGFLRAAMIRFLGGGMAAPSR